MLCTNDQIDRTKTDRTTKDGLQRRAGAIAIAAALALAVTAGYADAQVVRVSVATDGTQADGDSAASVISGNGKVVAFSSLATNLVTGDTNGTPDIFVRDLTGNTTTRVSVASDGTQGTGLNELGGISDDGTIVVFASNATLAGGTPQCKDQYGAAAPCLDVFVHDRTTGQTTRISVASDGTQGNGNSWRPRVSGNGRYVVFQSAATNLVAGDTNNVLDVFLHDRVAHTTTRVSHGDSNFQGTVDSHDPAISKDGLKVAFLSGRSSFGATVDAAPCSTAQDAPCDNAYVRTLAGDPLRALVSTAHGVPASPTSAVDVVLSADGRFAGTRTTQTDSVSIGTLTMELWDLSTGLMISTAYLPGFDPAGKASGALAMSDDGRYLASGGALFLGYSRQTALILDRLTALPEYAPSAAGSTSGYALTPSLDSSARHLAFASVDPGLVTGDTNAVSDIFVFDRDPDGDGIPTYWETRYGLNPNDATDAAADPDGDGLTSLQEFQANSHPTATHTRYFAEGAANTFFATRMALLNTGASAAKVLLHLLGSNGQQTSQSYTLAPNTRATVELADGVNLPDTVFSTIVESDQPVVADRMMTWDATGFGSHLETSIPSPSTTWYLAEGATGANYYLYYLLQNPGATDASVTVTYLLPTPQTPVVKTYTVPAHSRFTIDVRGEDPVLKAAEVSAKLESSAPIVVERALYANSALHTFDAGHDGAGITTPAPRWFLAEGATGFFDEYVLIANATATKAEMKVTYLLEGNTSFSETFPVDANSRYTVDLKARDPRLAATPVSVIVESTNSVPIVVERAMWWPHGNWYEASLSAGVTSTGTKWAIAEGEQGGTFKRATYVLIANTDPTTAGTATVTLYYEDGTSAQVTQELPANSRKSVDISNQFVSAANKRFAIVVESNGVPIVVERSLYQTVNGVLWAAGATSVATDITPVVP
jgi:Tol biopolymer transport system component